MTPAEIAKGALRRLAQARLEPTPDNYARAYAEEAGQPPPPDARAAGAQWAGVIERVVRGLERGSRQWTPARKKDSLQRVLEGSGRDAQRLQQRLQALLQAWESDTAVDAAPEIAADAAAAAPSAGAAAGGAPVAGGASPETAASRASARGWVQVTQALQAGLCAALPPREVRAEELAEELARLADRLAADGATPENVAAVESASRRAQRLLGHRHRLFDDLGRLCAELGAGMVDLAEDDSWARGQCEILQQRLAGGIGARDVRAATELLADARARQRRVREERAAASRALKDLIQRLLGELGELGEHAGRFGDSVGRHAEAIARAETLESLAGVVQALVEESHAVGERVRSTQQRLQHDHDRAAELEQRVRTLESELRRLSDEVATDALTAVANRRGLQQAFDAEAARIARATAGAQDAALAVGLIDIDNFKKLNDSLGHAAGDEALKSLAAAVSQRLRPVDTVARFGGEEFVVLLPDTAADEAQQALTRLQRELTASLFMHEGREVFVTFSAGVTAWRPGEALEAALERADEALYEAKRTGKNRTCLA